MSTNDSKPPKKPGRKWIVGSIPFLVLFAFLAYLWFVSGVLPYEEKYPNGKLKVEGYTKRYHLTTYLREGHWVTYHPDGKKASEGKYHEGKAVGEWNYWNAAGKATTRPCQ